MLLQLRRGFKCLLCFGWKKIWSKHWDLRCRQNYRNPPLINSQRQILIFSEPTFTFSNKLSLQQKAGGGDDPNTSEGTKLFSTITSNHCHLIHHPFSLSLSLQGADNPRTTFHVHKGEFDGHTMKTDWYGGWEDRWPIMILLQKRDFGEGCDDGWEDCPKYVFNGTTGTQLGANFCCRVFFLP